MEVFIRSFTAILQLFLIVGLGYGLAVHFRRSEQNKSQNKAKPDDFWNRLARLVYMVGLPALTVHTFAGFRWQSEHLWFAVVTVVATVVLIGVSILAVRFSPIPKEKKSTIASIVYRTNSVFLGFPLITAVVGPQALPLAALFVMLTFPLSAAGSIAILRSGQGTASIAKMVWAALRRMMVDPLILGCVCGILLSLVPLALPEFSLPELIRGPLGWLGATASPLALLVIGARMNFSGLREDYASMMVASLLKLCAAPLVGLAVAAATPLTTDARTVVVLLMGTPVAANTMLLVEQHEGDRALTANAITVTTLASILTLSVLAVML